MNGLFWLPEERIALNGRFRGIESHVFIVVGAIEVKATYAAGGIMTAIIPDLGASDNEFISIEDLMTYLLLSGILSLTMAWFACSLWLRQSADEGRIGQTYRRALVLFLTASCLGLGS
jgi:hypothetical protein